MIAAKVRSASQRESLLAKVQEVVTKGGERPLAPEGGGIKSGCSRGQVATAETSHLESRFPCPMKEKKNRRRGNKWP